MTDTIKIPRPKFPRADDGSSGRVGHDARGNAVWLRTRATDTAEVKFDPTLELVNEPGGTSFPVKPRDTKHRS